MKNNLKNEKKQPEKIKSEEEKLKKQEKKLEIQEEFSEKRVKNLEKSHKKDDIKSKFNMSEKESMDYIQQTEQYGSVLGLDNIKELLARLNNPQEQLKFIHIAGTNGKGSTVAYLSSVLKAQGYLVGSYISPTIFNYRERIQVNGHPITVKALGEHLAVIRDAVEKMVADGLPHPTTFEIETVLGFLYFKEKKCDFVVLETGLGGNLDATNVISQSVACVFTSISMDHMSYLGNSLKEIAEKKAGIIKNKCYVITTNQEPEVMEVLRTVAKEKNSCLSEVDTSQIKKIKYGLDIQKFSYKEYQDIQITLAGKYQITNAVLALETIDVLKTAGYDISENAIRKGFLQAKWPGRFQKIAEKPLFMVDGAHNEDGARKLADSIRFYFTNKRIIYIMGILKDKEYEKIIGETYAYPDHIITVTTPNTARSLTAYQLAQTIKEYHPQVTVADSLEEAVEISYLLADKDTVIIAFGSLSFLGPLIKIVETREKIRRNSHGRSKKS